MRPPPVPKSQPPTKQETAATHVGSSPSAAPGMELPAGMTVGEYNIERKIGEGGMATVYAARHPLIGKKAAIKVMSPDLGADPMAVERFIQEARAVNQIGHPNIVDIFAFGNLPDGRNYFVMEWLQGETLYERLARDRMGLAEAVEILFHVCDALEAAHENGIVHRDLKPENIFLVELRGQRKQVKLLDFGIAKLTSHAEGGKVLNTHANVVMGTPQYISPEQARARNVDHRTDIYSLGALAYEMFVGRPPFYSESVMAVVAMHLSDPVPPPRSLWPEIPPALESMLLGMLEKDPGKRPTLIDIREILAGLRDQYSGRRDDSGPVVHTLLYGEPPPPNTGPHRLVSSDAAAPDTLENDAAELAPRRSRSRFLLIGGAIGVVAVLGVLLAGRSSPSKATVTPAKPAPAQPVAALAPPPPEPAAPAPAERAVVLINTNVDDAHMELDGQLVAGPARNARLEVASGGQHEIVVSATGHKPFHKTFTAATGAIVEIPVTLKPVSSASTSRPAKTKSRGKEDTFHMLDPFAKP